MNNYELCNNKKKVEDLFLRQDDIWDSDYGQHEGGVQTNATYSAK